MSKEISISEVKKHKSKKSTWLILHNEVYDVTSFLAEHPGGEDTILEVAGKDGTVAFEDVGHSEDARQLLKKFKIGKLPVAEHSKTVFPCCKTKKKSCPAGNIKKSKQDKSWRTFDGSSSSSYPGSSHKEQKEPHKPKAERRLKSIIVPRESSNLKWAILALAGALIIGLALKKYMG